MGVGVGEERVEWVPNNDNYHEEGDCTKKENDQQINITGRRQFKRR